MSKRSNREPNPERDGLDQWLGLKKEVIAKRYAKLIEARQHDPQYEDMFHEGMHADLVTGKSKLNGGRPRGSVRPNVKLDLAVAEYWRRAAEIRAEGNLYGKAEDLRKTIAAEFGVVDGRLKSRLSHGKIRKKP
ncbi:hypothetical protein [Mesorhizobium sp. CA16]|uniref:hypothetical protein n=1 Tax=Mesorhizobium sp. CA16 TaxID=588496 RepID=UPI001CC91FD5|nr:hypothetical protein [Mesorhizobium sp. CA16]MBZ9914017.1 hypothetical protein [Mesorhizobium sp. CA16]